MEIFNEEEVYVEAESSLTAMLLRFIALVGIIAVFVAWVYIFTPHLT